ncbi:MAG TPA: M20/M25/M40 family metallo-hydrolase [Saprospiraceae bacterium]|nr:M20/M25/M40 family metallo-hydrolase [Saprospiraceae bacterium]HMQ82488.1 M20/M25/M40 family metallo-hydrolase [Saprospiraceae bacterium]
MKLSKLIFLILVIPFSFPLNAQYQKNESAEATLEKSTLEAHLRFLAADELMGRRTGEPGNNIAARYLAAQFQALGIKNPAGAENYYQNVAFDAISPPKTAQLRIDDALFLQMEDLLIMKGNTPDVEAGVVFANYGWVDEANDHNDYNKLNVKGKIVLVLPGTPDGQDPMSIFNAIEKKQRLAREQGALALIELYRIPFPWAFFLSYFSAESLSLAQENSDSEDQLVYGWLKEKSDGSLKAVLDGKKVKGQLSSSGFSQKRVLSQNVIGVIEGTDPLLKEEYILLSAHYDHVGTGKNGGAPYSPQDSIFNGARDNGMGTVALLAAAEALAKNPPKRSVIVLAVTGEEVGLLGSQYYADHPLIPLEKTIYNLNTDGAGYNDVSYVSVVGYGRTGIDDLVTSACNQFGLDVFPNPAPEQNLYDRSDNVSFAVKGVPAICFSPGLTEFDETVGKYYHQAADNPDSIDYAYLHKFSQAFARLARLISDRAERPFWVSGDKYEGAGKGLYGN